MARLKTVVPGLRTLRPAVAVSASGSAQTAWRADGAVRDFYKTARWRKLRWSILERDLFTCQWPGCGRVEADTALLVADHIVPVRIAPELRWEPSNLRCLCRACHDGPRAVEEARMYGPSPGWEGGGRT